jgi:bifunctional DNA-binding transcriptional regulator/antitoxin component of YhaV-PrlF toxin-antitoxin module
MRLQKRLSRKIGKKEYVKWVITIPPDDIEKLRWKEGEMLDSEVVDSSLHIKKKSKKDIKQTS